MSILLKNVSVTDALSHYEKFRSSLKGIQPRHAETLRLLLFQLAAAIQPLDAVSVSGNWRLIFQFEGQHAVNVDLLDYH